VKTCPCTIWGDADAPAVTSAFDTTPVELGVRFQAATPGVITGIRFYKGSGNTGVHTGRLWTDTGTLLGTVVFTNETPTGWQTAAFETPIPIAAGTSYVASYYAPQGGYAFDFDYFSAANVDRHPLVALQDAWGAPNNVYRYGDGGIFPTDSYGAANYWV